MYHSYPDFSIVSVSFEAEDKTESVCKIPKHKLHKRFSGFLFSPYSCSKVSIRGAFFLILERMQSSRSESSSIPYTSESPGSNSPTRQKQRGQVCKNIPGVVRTSLRACSFNFEPEDMVLYCYK